jgi:cell division protein FtsI/penicillin-binding protein 2
MARSRSRGAHAASHRAPRSGQLAGRAKLGRAMAGRLVPRRPAPKGRPAPAAGYATEQIAGDQVTELPATGIPATETPAAGLPVTGLPAGEPSATGGQATGGHVTGIPVAGTGDEAARRPARLSRVRSRLTLVRVAAIVCALAVLSFGLVEGGGAPSPSAEPTVQAFLLAWERGQYSAAAALTTGGQAEVAHSLSQTYYQLGAADLSLSMGDISQRGAVASARFNASFDLGRGGLPWVYQGRFTLRRRGSDWKIQWSPAVIVPGLRAGDRLAVLTTEPQRAQVLDATGAPLTRLSPVYQLGVRPGRLRHPGVTAAGLAKVTGLDGLASQVLGQIQAAPSGAFLELVTLRPAAYDRLSRRLGKIPGLIVRQAQMRLFDSSAPAIAGSVGTETARILRQDGVPYRPGSTVGLSGLQQAYQARLAGTPTTEIVVQNAATGRQVAVLRRWPGSPGSTVRTTIDPVAQDAADGALGSARYSAAIVAIRPGSGQILAVAEHQAAGLPAVSPLSGHYQPGQAFTIISTAALLQAGFSPSTRTPCNASNRVGGVNFLNVPAEPNLGQQPPFSTDFAHACGTAFVGASLNLTDRELEQAAAGFGIEAPWHLTANLDAFPGSIRPAAGYAQLAADSIGAGSVRVSPLDMALAAGVVQSGTWHPPLLVTDPPDPGLRPRAAFGLQVVSRLRSLMRGVVRNGAGKAAGSRGSVVYGQVGSAPAGKRLRANWFVGYYSDVAFAVLVLARSASVPAAPLAGRFVRALRSGS